MVFFNISVTAGDPFAPLVALHFLCALRTPSGLAGRVPINSARKPRWFELGRNLGGWQDHFHAAGTKSARAAWIPVTPFFPVPELPGLHRSSAQNRTWNDNAAALRGGMARAIVSGCSPGLQQKAIHFWCSSDAAHAME
jgi:hypothetical protein